MSVIKCYFLGHQFHPHLQITLDLLGLDPVNKQWSTPLQYNRPEKAMVPHSSTLAWKLPWMEEPGRRKSMGSPRVGLKWVTSLSLFTFMYWRRKWQSTPVFLSGESQGWGSLVGCRLWGHTELDTTEATYQQQQQHDWERQKSIFIGPSVKWLSFGIVLQGYNI